MPTVKELKELAKAKGITGFSRMVKADLEAALGLEPSEVKAKTSPKPRAAKKPAAVAPAPTPVASSPLVDLIALIAITATGEATTYLIQDADIPDYAKFKTQVALPAAERELDEAGVDLIDQLMQLNIGSFPLGEVVETPDNTMIISTVTTRLF